MIDLPLALHIPDGFLSGGVAAIAGVVAIAAVAYGLRVANVQLDEARVPLLGVLAAFIFAAQMLNFPIAGGTSGHFLGATLAAVLLGPWLACLVLAVVLTVQAFAFADGGISALGANVLNMGVLGALLAGGLVAAAWKLAPHSRVAFLGIVGVVSWLAVMVGAGATSVELALSDTVPLRTSLPAMLGVHALIGIGEAVITVAAVSAILTARPDLVALADFRPVLPTAAAAPPSPPAAVPPSPPAALPPSPPAALPPSPPAAEGKV
jgi:cobalt/nickel transport system permease protein